MVNFDCKRICFLILIFEIKEITSSGRGPHIVESCTVTAYAPENYIELNLKYNSTRGLRTDQTKIIMNLALGTLTDFGNICSNVMSPTYYFTGCDNSNPWDLILHHDFASYQSNIITLKGINFPPEGQSFPIGSVHMDARTGREWDHETPCEAFSSPSFNGIIYTYIWCSSEEK